MKSLRLHLTAPILVASVVFLVLAACTTPTPTAPSPPVATSALAPATAAPTVAATKVAPPAAQANSGPKGQLVFVATSEPETVLPKNACGRTMDYIMMAVYDHLTYRASDGQIVGQLAESFERTDPKTWRFKLRKDIKFSNGEPFNADAIVAAVKESMDPASLGTCSPEFGWLLPNAKKVDDYTVDLLTSEEDPILPTRLLRFSIPAPAWYKANQATAAQTAVGSGPYLLAEWVKGDHVLLKANENYWGPDKPSIAEIKILGRNEVGVRAAMVQAGEAQFAYTITPDQAKQVPNVVYEQVQEVVTIRVDIQNPVLKDVRVRQAIAYSIDSQSIMKNLYPGLAGDANGQPIRPSVVGFNPNLKPYPYNIEQAKKLVQEAGATGATVQLIARSDAFARENELAEIVVNGINQIGLKGQMTIVDATKFKEWLYAVKPGDKHADLLLDSWSNSILDSSRVLISRYTCSSTSSLVCDAEFEKKITAAGALTGEARAKAFQPIWAEAYDKVYAIPLFGMNNMDGVSPKLKWTPRKDGYVYFAQMQLADGSGQ